MHRLLYKSIIIKAVTMMKLFSFPLSDKGNLINTGSISKTIIELIPSTKESFEKWDEVYAFYWTTYFHDEILRALRYELSGADDMTRDSESIQRLALDSRRAQINIRSSLAQIGLPENLINPHEKVVASSLAAESFSE